MHCDQLLPDIIDSRAGSDPLGTFAKIPRENAYENGYRAVTNLAVATAINHVANLITSTFGQSNDHERIAYLGLSDLRYTIVLLAGIKTGFTIFLPSPRNSEEAQISLFTRLACFKLITTYPMPVAVSIVEKIITTKLIIPTLDELIDLDPSHIQPKTYRKGFENARTDPIFILHTSGSTGIPKPIIYSNEWISRAYNTQTLVPPEGYTSIDEKFRKGCYLVTLPPFHIAGLVLTLIFPAFYKGIPVYPTAGTPATMDVFLGALNSTPLDWAFVSPVIVDEIGRDPKILETVVNRLDYLFFSGGSVPRDSGLTVAQNMGLYQILGSSECSALPLIRSKYDWCREDWHYVHIHPGANVKFEYRFDNYYELVQIRRQDNNANEVGERYQPVFCHFEGMQFYETRDLFVKHPSSSNLFSHVGRIDDIVVFLNGEKTNPTTFQDEIAKHPEVYAALLVGQQRQEAALLIEPTVRQELSEEAKRDLVENIWPTIEDSNKYCPRHAKVAKDKVLIASASMPFLRTAKGTVQRRGTLALYKDILDRFFEETAHKDEDKSENHSITHASLPDLASPALGDEVSEMVQSYQSKIDALLQEDLAIKTTMSRNRFDASLDRLDAAEHQRIVSQDARWPRQRVTAPQSENAILLTGSTGALGSHILDALLESTTQRIYCLNQSLDSQDLQIRRNKSRGLPADFPHCRVTFLTGDLALPCFGLSGPDFEDLQKSVVHVIHNAWLVNFNESLQSYAGCLDGVIGLVQFATRSPRRVMLQLVSSIASVAGYTKQSVIPESAIADSQAPLSMGYGQSKYIAERILECASQILGLKTICARVGQISGDSLRRRGWNRQEWFPSLVISSLHIRALPDTLGCLESSKDIRWIPVNSVARILLEVSDIQHSTEANTTFHIVHPKPSRWTELLPTVNYALNKIVSEKGGPLVEVVSYREWVMRLRAISNVGSFDGEALTANPAVKLLPFFESVLSKKSSLGTFELGQSMASSSTMRTLQPLEKDCLEAWVNGWIQDL
ncbi:hypothetical protein BDV95DRAFT_490710 [Massariosphaeria phaeospora]|uniref:NRPS-like enzyme n=1 Tax=Massariosphaeria phaeospora TaxID=100035 RepID=A0A7C8MMW7_9PLEO|nr:hypothetical protein BDV95DRAFT_490710 [Massariosphaeria phaeospora]